MLIRSRVIVSILLGVAIGLPIASITAAGVFRRTAPDLVLYLAPFDAGARAIKAQELLIGKRDTTRSRTTASPPRPSAVMIEEARRQAIHAFDRDVTAVRALTALGIIAGLEGDGQRAQRLFLTVQGFTRRDDQSQLWLLNDRIANNDIPGALVHYDTLLRTSRRLWQPLFTVLAKASSEPEIAREVNLLLRRKPLWWSNFLHHVYDTTGDPVALSYLNRGLLDPSKNVDQELAGRLIARLLHDDVRRFDLAWAAYTEMADASTAALTVRNPHFAGSRLLPPFDWEFSRDPALSPERRPRPEAANGYSLYLPTAPTTDGAAARQLLRLDPGSYRLTTLVGNMPRDRTRRPHIRIRCAQVNDQLLADVELRANGGAAGTPLAVPFTIQRSCPYQWLSIDVRGVFDPPEAGEGGWVDFVQIVRTT